VDAEALEGGLDLLQHRRDGIAFERGEPRDVVAVVAVLGRLLAPPHRLDGRPETVHLRPGVVVVVLPLDLVPGELEQPRHRVAVRAVTGRRDRDRARRVRGDHLDLDPLRRSGIAGAVALALAQDLLERPRVPLVGEPEVDEAGAGDLGALDVLELCRRGRDLLAQLARRAAAHGCEPHGGVRGVVAVRRVARPLELHLGAHGLAEVDSEPLHRVRRHRRLS
jgi:hypothetical protein